MASKEVSKWYNALEYSNNELGSVFLYESIIVELFQGPSLFKIAFQHLSLRRNYSRSLSQELPYGTKIWNIWDEVWIRRIEVDESQRLDVF